MFPNESNLETMFTLQSERNPSPEEPPFHILVLGNWSGDGNQKELSERKPIVIDRDNFDDVLNRLKVSVDLDLQSDGSNNLILQFSELDDFHPNNLFRNVAIFDELRGLRKRLLNTDTFESAANEVRDWFSSEVKSDVESDVKNEEKEVSRGDSENLLDQILTGSRETSAKPQRVDNTDLGRLISKVVAPFLVEIDENEQSRLVATVDEATSELMRQILHHPRFQELESAWRGLYFLVRRIETDVDLKIFIYDISKDELNDNLKSVNNLTDTYLYRWLIRETIETPGGEPFSVVAGNYSFGLNVDDIATLMRLGKLSSAADAPFISYIQPKMFGIDSFGQKFEFSDFKFSEDSNEGKLWTALRSVPEARYLGLSPMKLLARLPFGEATDSIEVFSFEEFTDTIKHENYLWINPCFAAAFLLAKSYRQFGWEMGQALQTDIENLPLYLYKEENESKTKPCAEIVLTESLAENILDQGLMPLISFRDSDRIRLLRFQSISSTVKNLGGRW